MLFPVLLFVIQAIVAANSHLNNVLNYYLTFLISYCLFFSLAYKFTKKAEKNQPIEAAYWLFNFFLLLKLIVIVYFSLIFAEYISQNGYLGIRGYMTSEAIKNNSFYYAPLMYLDSYILSPLNYIAIIFFIQTKKFVKLILLALEIIIHFSLFYASRMIIYNFFILFIIYSLYAGQWKKGYTVALFVLGISLATVLQMNRDKDPSFFESKSQLASSLASFNSVIAYHEVPPFILSKIKERSELFNSPIRHSLATFGFISDPFVALFVKDNSRQYMDSKLMSQETQKFTIEHKGNIYNGFTTFLWPAIYDFGFWGPIIYGIFFGTVLGWSLKCRDLSRQLIFIITSFFIYFNSFTFFITGDWFIVLLIGYFFYRKNNVNSKSPFNALVFNRLPNLQG
jgi:oligosaccharide repeat unit polymerase